MAAEIRKFLDGMSFNFDFEAFVLFVVVLIFQSCLVGVHVSSWLNEVNYTLITFYWFLYALPVGVASGILQYLRNAGKMAKWKHSQYLKAIISYSFFGFASSLFSTTYYCGVGFFLFTGDSTPDQNLSLEILKSSTACASAFINCLINFTIFNVARYFEMSGAAVGRSRAFSIVSDRSYVRQEAQSKLGYSCVNNSDLESSGYNQSELYDEYFPLDQNEPAHDDDRADAHMSMETVSENNYQNINRKLFKKQSEPECNKMVLKALVHRERESCSAPADESESASEEIRSVTVHRGDDANDNHASSSVINYRPKSTDDQVVPISLDFKKTASYHNLVGVSFLKGKSDYDEDQTVPDVLTDEEAESDFNQQINLTDKSKCTGDHVVSPYLKRPSRTVTNFNQAFEKKPIHERRECLTVVKAVPNYDEILPFVDLENPITSEDMQFSNKTSTNEPSYRDHKDVKESRQNKSAPNEEEPVKINEEIESVSDVSSDSITGMLESPNLSDIIPKDFFSERDGDDISIDSFTGRLFTEMSGEWNEDPNLNKLRKQLEDLNVLK